MEEKKKRPNRLRSRMFPLRLLDEEYEVLEIKAQEAGMTKVELLRNLILYGAAHKRTVFSDEEAKAMRYELNRIGNNINQIALWANTMKKGDRGQFERLFDEYRTLLSEFNRIVGE